MKISAKKYAYALMSVLQEADSKARQTQAMRNFIALLAHKRALKQLDAVLRELAGLYDAQNQSLTGTLVSAHAPDAQSLEMITKALTALLDKKEVNLEKRTDKTLLGGFKAVFPEVIIDASIKGRINALKQELLQ